MPRFFIRTTEITGDAAALKGTEFRHLQRVLRLREGDQVTLFDDAGQEHAGVVLSLSPRVAHVRITASHAPARESPLAITLYQGVPKGRKMDLVVEKATELGTHAIVPFTSAFSIGTAAAAESKRERWQRIAFAAAKQSGRTAIPTVLPARTFREILTDAATHVARLLFFEGTGVTPFDDVVARSERAASAAVIVGPEGGFSADEVAAAEAAGFALVGLGPRVLRTETAALVAVTLVQAAWGDLTRR